ncbi:hypothetical protein N7450_007617 [Penicillium hetheringtonii]|uniref:ABM domain-containing protein n=1 Tax=Penicillium hetheringtonii TaxID=911720 RepID=A0AAD6DII4_9EURO|nr:hypothetical protein N7450_007617 [Penicillium hetheringtonii]
MAVTELALLRLKAPEPSAVSRKDLRAAQQGQSEYSGHPVKFLRSVEDQSDFFLIGGWESVDQHRGEWIISEMNQRLLGKLKDAVDVKWMFHLDIDPSAPVPFSAPIIGVARCFVEQSNKAEFDRLFAAGFEDLKIFTAPYPCFGGWRIDKEGEDEEFVLFTGWNSVEQHQEFYKSELSREFAKTKSVIKQTDVKHVQLEKWE